MANPQYQTRLPKDTAEAIDEYADDFDLSESEVMRRAARRFVRQEGYLREVATDGGAPTHVSDTIGATAIIASAAVALFVVGTTTPLITPQATGAALFGLGLGSIIMGRLVGRLTEDEALLA